MPQSVLNEGGWRGLTGSSRQRPLLWLILLGLVLGFAFQGTRGLWSPDEGRYVGAALQMLDSGNYLAPAYSPSELNFSKPPLTYWVIAASLQVFGRNTWAARAPYAVSFVLTMWVLYAMGKRLVPGKPWLPGLIYGCTLFPFFTANIISTDVFLTLFEGLAVLGFIRSIVFDNERDRRQGVTVMWLGFGLAFLTKGPPGLLPLLAILIYAASRDGWRGMGRLFTLAGIAAFLLVGFTWYLLAAWRYPWLLHYFLHQEVYGRIFTAVHRRHPGIFGWAVVYLPVLILGSLPWWPALTRAVRSGISQTQWSDWYREHAIEPFLLLWFLVPFAVFCLSQSRLPLYVLPLFLPLALLAALQLRDSLDLQVPRQRVVLCLWVIALVAAKGVAAYSMHPAEDNRQAAREIAAMAPLQDVAAVIVIVNTDAMYAIEEQTPWGLRLYLNKPVYGVAWRAPEGAASLCSAIRDQRHALVIVDHTIDASTVQPALASCQVQAMDPLGTWRGNPLLRVQG
ncbi:glycosyltransferase family 39 protein [Dyella halodurans]|uniref:ArnT family glycosyltransferase n=1 Tax=Dyella halodurans TaxID=1920171 RepID=A0ABV9C477_9GAMM|nr:glycosyltransferase family 39 protein [Dyella halodurans]